MGNEESAPIVIDRGLVDEPAFDPVSPATGDGRDPFLVAEPPCGPDP